MKIRKGKNQWAECVKNNSDPYGLATVQYAERWAELMETKLATGKSIEGCAKTTSHDADTDEITGCMYGYAVLILSAVWVYGEALRIWHNLDTQIADEGEKANQTGGVLNPALLNLG